MSNIELAPTGAATLASARALYGELVEAFGHSAQVTVDLAGVTEADVSFVQLLVSGTATARARAGTFTLRHPSAAVTRALSAAGLTIDPGSGTLLGAALPFGA